MSVIVKETLCEEDSDDDDADDADNNATSNNDGTSGASANIPDIPLPNVSAFILSKVIEYCKHYQQVEVMTPIVTPLKSSKLDELVQSWYVEYIKVERTVLFDLVAAANFMDIKPLLDLSCLAVSILIKGKSATELREMFNIANELTTDEEAQIQRENAWAENPPTARPASSSTMTPTTTTTPNNIPYNNSNNDATTTTVPEKYF